jgi:hypothetical protein
MQNKSYIELFDLVKSLAGVNSFTDEETTYILNFVNRRFYEAFDTSEIWPRYLVVGEARDTTNSVVPFTQTSKNNIGQFLRIHRNQPFLRNSEIEYDFFVDASGAHIMNEVGGSSNGDVYVTYKKEFTPTTGSTLTTDTSIPLEFFYYISHAAYADFLRMDGQIEKALAEERRAEGFLDLELDKIEILSNNNSVGKKISTYVNRQSR